MVSRRAVLSCALPAVSVLSGCTSQGVGGPELVRSLGFRRTAEFLTQQPSLDAQQPTVASVLVTEQNAESAVANWEMLLDSTAQPYKETEYGSEFLVVHVGVVDRGQQISVGRPTVENGNLSYDASVVAGSEDPPDTDGPIISYRLEQWRAGPLFAPKSVSTTFS